MRAKRTGTDPSIHWLPMASKAPDKDRAEDICAAIACSVLGAQFRRRDVRGVSGTAGLHDFDLEFTSGGRVDALEVCFFTDPEVRRRPVW